MTDETDLRRQIAGANDNEDDATTALRKLHQRAMRELEAPTPIDHVKAAIPRACYLHLLVGDGAATLSFRPDATRPSRVYVGVSMCSPLDQYARKRGRLIADRRREHLERVIAAGDAYGGLAFVYAGAVGAPLARQTYEAFESWINAPKSPRPIWLNRWRLVYRRGDDKSIPITLRRSLGGGLTHHEGG